MQSTNRLTIIMPMAGRAQRFKDVGILTPKPLIDVAGQPMILRTLSSIGFVDRIPTKKIVAIVRQEDIDHFSLDAQIRHVLPETSVLVDRHPRGATGTTLVAADYILPNSSVLVMDCDIWFKSTAYEKLVLIPPSDVVGVIPVFDPEGDRWSFSAVDSDMKIIQIVEKQRIHLPDANLLANVGFYFFTQGDKFIQYAERSLRNTMPNKECYLSTVVQEMIESEGPFQAAMCEKVVDMGTPQSHKLAQKFFRNTKFA